MKIQFNKRKIANNCTFLAYYLILTCLVLSIFAIADLLFRWDIFPWGIQQVLLLMLWVTILSILGSFVINLMVNLSRIADSLEDIHELKNPDSDEQ